MQNAANLTRCKKISAHKQFTVAITTYKIASTDNDTRTTYLLVASNFTVDSIV